MFEFKTLIVTKRGSRQDDVKFSVHSFPVSSQAEVDAILRHPSIAGWKYGYSVGMSREQMSDLSAIIKLTNKGNEMTTAEMKMRYNELMRIAKGDEYMSMTELDELLALTKKLAK